MQRIVHVFRGYIFALALAAAFGAYAQEASPERQETRPETRSLPFSAFFSEAELRDLFDYLRDAVIAHMKEEAPPALPPELLFKLEVMKQRMLREGDLAVRMLLLTLQRELERARLEMERRARERQAPPRNEPPAVPAIPPGERTRT